MREKSGEQSAVMHKKQPTSAVTFCHAMNSIELRIIDIMLFFERTIKNEAIRQEAWNASM